MVRRCLLLLVFLSLVAPGAAFAGELRPLELPDGSRCVNPTGAPGELAVQTPAGVSVFSVGRSGFTAGPKLDFAARYPCRRVVGRASGAAVIAAETDDGGLAVSVREP